MDFYFKAFENRKPPEPIPYSAVREMLWQFLAVIMLVVGAWYLHWRWTASLNLEALWFAYPLVIAETGAYIGLLLFSYNLWFTRDFKQQSAPSNIRDCVSNPAVMPSRPLRVDVFFPTYDEEVELVRLSILDAKKITYPHPIDVKIYVLDDGKRDAMQQMAHEEGAEYITRDNNIGFKAGNLRHAMSETSGDFIVICDADTRPFPTILENTLGYFRDPSVAWVQTPQWFFDLPEGETLSNWLGQKLYLPGKWIGKLVERVVGTVKIGEDPFVNDPKMFYDIIQRRRNWLGASFCCGAGSIHRRDAVMEAALKQYVEQVTLAQEDAERQIKKTTGESLLDPDIQKMIGNNIALETELTPYKFHVSEDIYTSMVLHSEPNQKWRSVMHPKVESKMLSPQDLQTWMVQRFKYAGGTLDIALRDNPIFKRGMSLGRKMMYASTMWSYLGGIWNLLFLFAPIVYLFTGIAPVSGYSFDFYLHILPFIFFTELAMMMATWGIPGFKSKANYLAFFAVNLKALWTVIRGEQIKFPVTPKTRQEGTFAALVWPQILVVVLTLIGFVVAFLRFSLDPLSGYELSGLLANAFWGGFNIIAMSGLIYAAFWQPKKVSVSEHIKTEEVSV